MLRWVFGVIGVHDDGRSCVGGVSWLSYGQTGCEGTKFCGRMGQERVCDTAITRTHEVTHALRNTRETSSSDVEFPRYSIEL